MLTILNSQYKQKLTTLILNSTQYLPILELSRLGSGSGMVNPAARLVMAPWPQTAENRGVHDCSLGITTGLSKGSWGQGRNSPLPLRGSCAPSRLAIPWKVHHVSNFGPGAEDQQARHEHWLLSKAQGRQMASRQLLHAPVIKC